MPWLEEIKECGERMTPYARQKLLEAARAYATAFPLEQGGERAPVNGAAPANAPCARRAKS